MRLDPALLGAVAVGLLIATGLHRAANVLDERAEREAVYGSPISDEPWGPSACGSIYAESYMARIAKRAGARKSLYMQNLAARLEGASYAGELVRAISTSWDSEDDLSASYKSCLAAFLKKYDRERSPPAPRGSAL